MRRGRVPVPSGIVWLLFVSACSPADTPTGPTPAQLAPGETFSLPVNAPADAAAPSGTTRITITTLEILRTDGSRAQPTQLTPGIRYRQRVWVYCPRGLEGSVDARVDVSGHFTALRLTPGYNALDLGGTSFSQPGTHTFTLELIQSFVTIATYRLTLFVGSSP